MCLLPRAVTLVILCLLSIGSVGFLQGCAKTAAPLQIHTSNAALLEAFVPSTEDKTVFASVQNMTDQPQLATTITELLAQNLSNKQYHLVKDPEQANYQIHIKLRYFGRRNMDDINALLKQGANKKINGISAHASTESTISTNAKTSTAQLALITDIEVLQKTGQALQTERKRSEIHLLQKKTWRLYSTRLIVTDDNPKHDLQHRKKLTKHFAQRLTQFSTGIF